MRRQHLLYSDTADKSILEGLIVQYRWEYDMPGFITSDELTEIIKQNHIIPQKSILNGRTHMDAENYYVQAGDLHPISQLKDKI